MYPIFYICFFCKIVHICVKSSGCVDPKLTCVHVAGAPAIPAVSPDSQLRPAQGVTGSQGGGGAGAGAGAGSGEGAGEGAGAGAGEGEGAGGGEREQEGQGPAGDVLRPDGHPDGLLADPGRQPDGFRQPRDLRLCGGRGQQFAGRSK